MKAKSASRGNGYFNRQIGTLTILPDSFLLLNVTDLLLLLTKISLQSDLKTVRKATIS